MAELPGPLQELATGIKEELLVEFKSYGKIVEGHDTLASRVSLAVERIIAEGVPALGGLMTFHNELCVALDLLRSAQDSGLTLLDYEPTIVGADRKIDFRWKDDAGHTAWIEVKTIQPAAQDDSEKLAKLKRRGRFPQRVEVYYGGNIGGELFHASYAARAKMLDYALETEEKIEALGIDPDVEPVTLAFCNNGFDWTEDELEDFVAFCSTGEHRADDAYREMENDHITQQGISLTSSISRFAYLERPTSSLRPTKKNWLVTSPGFS